MMNLDQTTPSILIGTPCYGGNVHQDYVQSVIEFHKLGIPIAFMHIGNESLITRGRNTILSFYYANRSNFTHLLYLDADIYLAGQDLMKMINYKVDVVAAPVPLKGFDQNGNKVYNVTEIIEPNSKTNANLAEVEHVGTAVFMLSQKAIESLVNKAIENNDVYKGNPLTRGNKVDCDHYDVFKTGVFDGKYLSEDYYVCKVLRDLGYTVYVDKTISTRHSGMFTWQG